MTTPTPELRKALTEKFFHKLDSDNQDLFVVPHINRNNKFWAMENVTEDVLHFFAEREAVRDAIIKDANEVLRSCHSVAERKGETTNWEPLKESIYKALTDQHDFMHL